MRDEYDLSNAVKGRHAACYRSDVEADLDELPQEVDFSNGVRGRFAGRIGKDENTGIKVEPSLDPKAS